jgi:hypothetical protein
MTDKEQPPSGKAAVRAAREERLAAALRQNLKRRKAAAKAGPAPASDRQGRRQDPAK